MPDRRTDLLPVLVHLSGDQRGRAELIDGESVPLYQVGKGTAGVRAGGPNEPMAALERRGQSFEIVAPAGRTVWVNGEQVSRLVLASGDVIELGAGGPVLRFRLHERSSAAYKSLTEVFSDCWACARYDRGGALKQAAVFLGGVPMELATRTTRAFRLMVLVVLLGLGSYTVILGRRSRELERDLAADRATMEGIGSLVAQARDNPSNPAELLAVLQQVRDSLGTASARLGALETRSRAVTRVIEAAARSTIYVQGAFGFNDPRQDRPLRFRAAANGEPIKGPDGAPLVTLEGNGPLVEAAYSGTGFLIGSQGLALTNRHVAVPWAFDEGAAQMIKVGWRPVLRRFIVYLPGVKGGLSADPVMASEDADVAVIRIPALAGKTSGLTLAAAVPAPGDEVIVLGYPLGIRALMARTDARVVQGLMNEPGIDLWSAADRLSRLGAISPLASRGIVGQVTGEAVVYDAQTTHGGSGGPVLSLAGDVVAINAAILPEYGGSNIGVPVARARALLAKVATSPR